MRIGKQRARRGKEGAENTGRADPRGLAEFCCFSQSGLEPLQGQQKPAGPVSERPPFTDNPFPLHLGNEHTRVSE